GEIPVITTVSLADAELNTSYSASLTATGATPITWRITSGKLPTGLTLNSAGTITGTPTAAGIFTFTVQASNNYGSASKQFTISIFAVPEITTNSLPNGTENKSYNFTVIAAGSTPITWTLDSGTLPDGLSLNSSGKISGTPTTAGTFTFTVKAANSYGNDSKEFTITISESTTEGAPVITTTEILPGSVKQNYSFQLNATGSAPITWKIIGGKLPQNLKLSTSGLISGTIKSAGKSSFIIQASNTYGTDSKSFTISNYVLPVITTKTLANGKIDKAYNKKLACTGTKPLTWTLEGNLPEGLSFDIETGKFYGIPKEFGTYSLTITLSNPAGEDKKNFILNIAAIPPKITTSKLSNGTYLEEYESPIKLTGTEPITFTISDNLPEGLYFDETSRTIKGIPQEQCNNLQIKFTAENTAGKASKTFKLTIKKIAPAIKTSSLPEGMINTEYSADISVTGSPTINITASGLPMELSINDNQISGIPTESGNFTVTIYAENDSKKVSKKLKLVISAPPGIADDESLPDGTINTKYSHKIIFSGTKPVTFTLTDGTLPAGITLKSNTGTISGTPKEIGTFIFTVTATNKTGTFSQIYNLTIKGIAPTIKSIFVNGTVGKAYVSIIRATGTAPITWEYSGNLPAGLEFDEETGTLSGTPTEAFDEYITIIAENSGGQASKNLRLIIRGTSTTSKSNSDDVKEPEQEINSESINHEQKIFIGPERDINSIKFDSQDKYIIAAVLPEIHVTESGLYDLDLDIELDEKINTGAKLIWLACPQNHEPSEDDLIAEFFDETGQEIITVPESHVIKISAWLTKEVIYCPVIVVERE
ncbi:MAG: putative Ig domain-containing protein, partial [Synergistaceae bacterium]|nr:putative Ig domain-containing protein [Synergistaceae bacterium]